MERSRRRVLQLAGASIATTLAAGCLSTAEPSDDGNGPNDDGENGNGTDGNDGSLGDGDDFSIDGRLHNESPSTQTFTVSVREDGSTVAETTAELKDGETRSLPAFGRPGEPRTFEVTVNGTTATETLSFDVEDTPGMKDGYVDITYTEDGTVDISFTPVRDGDNDEHRVDQPPYEIDEPECEDDTDGNPRYLCENMPADPSLAFEQESTSQSVLADEGLSLDMDTEATGDHQFYATFLTEDSDLARLEDDRDGPTAEFIENTDFESEVVLVVETGWGSGTVTPHLKRIEATDDGVHAFGCYRRPCVVTTDVTSRTVAARFERPDTLALAGVSLTVDADTRITFDTTDSVVTVETA